MSGTWAWWAGSGSDSRGALRSAASGRGGLASGAEEAGPAARSSTLWAEEAAARRGAGEPGELEVADRAPASGPRELTGCGLDIAGARVQSRAPGSGSDYLGEGRGRRM